jgi:LPS export ABC transporter protein LptC
MDNEQCIMASQAYKTSTLGCFAGKLKPPRIIHYTLYIIHFFFFSCEETKTTKITRAFTGPIEEINDVKMLYSEQAIVKVKMTTARQLRYINDDRRYPQEVNVVFYGPTGQEVTTLRSDSGKYNRATDLYTVMGNVVVINKIKQEKMTTDLLNWNPNTKKIYTEKPVTVLSRLTGERLTGIGLDATQDFSQYSMRKPTGVFNVQGTPF